MLNIEKIDNFLSENFSNEVQVKRIKKELYEISDLEHKNLHFSLKSSRKNEASLIIEVKTEIIPERENITFKLDINELFPSVAPRIYCLTPIGEPCLCDGRDYFADITKSKIWNPSTKLAEIISKLTEFLKEIAPILKSNDKFRMEKLGCFHLNQLYNIKDFLNYPNIAVFPANEYISLKKTVFRYILITEGHFLTLEPENDSDSHLTILVSYAPIFALLKLIKRKKNGSSTIILSWHDYKRKEGILQILSLNEEGKFVERIIRNLKQFETSISKTVQKTPDLSLDEVTINIFKNLDKETLFKTIQEMEEKSINHLDAETIDSLSRLYQSAIEYYSAFSDDSYNLYLKRLHDFLNRTDVADFFLNQDKSSKKLFSIIKNNIEQEVRKSSNKDLGLKEGELI